MDDKTLIICAATLCVVGTSLTHALESKGNGLSSLQVVSANISASSPAVEMGGLGSHAANARWQLLPRR